MTRSVFVSNFLSLWEFLNSSTLRCLSSKSALSQFDSLKTFSYFFFSSSTSIFTLPDRLPSCLILRQKSSLFNFNRSFTYLKMKLLLILALYSFLSLKSFLYSLYSFLTSSHLKSDRLFFLYAAHFFACNVFSF